MKATKANLSKLEDVFSELQYNVRYEKGSFKPNYCIVESRKLILINAFYDVESRFNTLKEILFILPIDLAQIQALSEHATKLYQLLKPKEVEQPDMFSTQQNPE